MKIYSNKLNVIMTTILLSMVPMPTLVGAQETQPSDESVGGEFRVLDEIVVTARRRAESLQDVPIAIEVFSADDVQKLGIDDIADVAKYTAGFNVDRGVLPNDVRPSLRGISAERGRSSVAVLIDGIDITSESFISGGASLLAGLKLAEIERVEVVKGPQSALYGRSAFGGAINYVTKRPQLDETSGFASVSYGDTGETLAQASISGPVVGDVLSLGLSANYFDDGGEYTNTTTGGKIGQSDGFGVGLSGLYQPSDSFSAFARVQYSDEHFGPPAAVFERATRFVPFSPAVSAVTNRDGETIQGGLVNSDLTTVAYNRDPFTLNDFRGADVETVRGSLVMEWESGGFAITSLTGYLDADATLTQDLTYQTSLVEGQFPAFQIAGYINDTSQLSQEIRIASNDDSNFSWLAGLAYWNEDADQDGNGLVGLGLQPVSERDYLAFASSGAEVDLQGRDFGREITHTSVFGSIGYDFTPNWNVTLEGRYTSDEIDYSAIGGTTFFGFFTADSGLDAVSLGGATSTISTAKVKEDYFVPRLSTLYKVGDDLSVYGAIGKGVKPSGNNTTATTFSEQSEFLTETLWSYELGMKGSLLDGALSHEFAIFYQDYTNQQVSTQELVDNQLRGTTKNAGESETKGFEAALTWRPSPAWTLGASYLYLDAEFTDFVITSTSPGRIAEAGCSRVVTIGGSQTCELDYTGLTPPNTSKHSFNASLAYEVETKSLGDVFVNVDGFYKSGRFHNIANNIESDDKFTADIRIGTRIRDIEAFVFVNNVFDDDTIDRVSSYVDFVNFGPGTLLFLPDRREIGVRVRANF